MVAIGVGGADAVDVMTGFPFNVRWPKVIGVHLTGSLSGWSSPEGRHPEGRRDPHREGGTGAIVEYFGPGADTISATGKATICNMGAEIGATTLAVPVRREHGRLPEGHRPRSDRRRRRRRGRPTCGPTRGLADPAATSTRSSRSTSTSSAADQRPALPRPAPTRSTRSAPTPRRNGWPLEISSALIGSCTNSSYEDITRAASIARQAVGQGPHVQDAAARHPGLRAGARHDRARRSARRPRGHRRHRARQRLRTVHRPVGAHRPRPVHAEHDRQQLQPQLPEAQRRQRQHPRVRHLARHGDRATPSPARSTSTLSPTRSPTTPASR